MAPHYPYSTRPNELYTPAEDPLDPGKDRAPEAFFQDWSSADKQNLPLLCAELSRLVYGRQTLVTNALPRADLELLTGGWLGGPSLVEEIRTQGTDGFVAGGADGTTYLVFRGTEVKFIDIVTDLQAWQIDWGRGEGGKVHKGFKSAYDTVRETLNTLVRARPGKLVITGHSLGAALATLAAADFADRHPTLITFGSPRVGDAAFARNFVGMDIKRYIDCADIVTRVPLASVTKENVADVFNAFLGDRWIVDRLDAGVAAALLETVGNLQYEHVGEIHYINRHGVEQGNPGDEIIGEDRKAARAEYGGAFGDVHLLDGLAGFQEILKTLIAGGPDRAPFRDLADHTPLNYVSAFTGR